MSISRLVRLFMIVLYLLKPVSIIHYLEHVSDNFWLFYYCLCFTYIQIHIFHLNSLFLIFTYVCLTWCSIFWCCRCLVVTDHVLYLRFPCAFTATFHIILSYKFSVVFSYDIRCISMTCMHISIYMWVCEHDIFINIFNIFFNFLHISSWIFLHKCIVYKVFKWLFSTWCIIFCHSSFQCCMSCFFCNSHPGWGYYKQ